MFLCRGRNGDTWRTRARDDCSGGIRDSRQCARPQRVAAVVSRCARTPACIFPVFNRRPGRRRTSARAEGGAMRRGFAPWADQSVRPLVRFEGVTKRFGGVTAVDGLSLDIYEGEFFALLGPSGCGKTTLLRMLAGFETPDAGAIRLGADDIGRVPPYRRPINMMFQSYALFPHLTVAGNIAFGLKQEGLPKAQISTRVEEML